MKTIEEAISGFGHGNIRATHRNTFEFTKDEHLTPRGDCIVCIKADKGMNDLSDDFKKALCDDGAKLLIKITCGGATDEIIARGSKDLILDHKSDMVIRKSSFVCGRTLAICADKSASELDRALIREMEKGSRVEIKLKVI